MFCIVAGFGLYFFETHITPKKIPANQCQLHKIQFSSNGTITGHWLAKALSIRKNIRLSEVDISAIKKRLLTFSQVRDVYVEKRFPDSMIIKISERHPLLKFAIRKGDAVELLFVDSQDGTIFTAACMPKSLMLATPYVDLKLETSKNSPIGLKNVQGIEIIAQLVNALRMEYPEIYKQIRKFSLKKYDCRNGAAWSRIEVTLKNGQTIAFGHQHIDIQLVNLDYLISERELFGMNIKKIDLAKIDSVIVENQ
jgi:cell division septal protein FtsQ